MGSDETFPFFSYAPWVAVQFLLVWSAGLLGCWATERFWKSWLLGGLIAGILLSPWVFGILAPQLHQRIFVGGIEADRALRAFVAERQKGHAALVESKITDVGIAEYDAETKRETGEFESRMERERLGYKEAVGYMLLYPVGILLVLQLVLEEMKLAYESDGLFRFIVWPVIGGESGHLAAADMTGALKYVALWLVVLWLIRRRKSKSNNAMG
jgi:hypothetical protein